MPAWVGIAVGIVAGASVIAGAVYLAFRPYLAVKPPKAWMPEQAGRMTGTDYTGAGGGALGGDGLSG